MTFKFPDIYEFPPFFTKQPNEATLKSQISQWIELSLEYCKDSRLFILRFNDELFENAKINRKCSTELRLDIFNEIVNQNKGAWQTNGDNDDKSVFIYWNSVQEWSQIIYDYIENNGLMNKVLTLYEILQWNNPIFEKMPEIFLTTILKTLKKENKAVILQDDNKKVVGVKFI